MARIKSYAQDTNVTDQDRILGTSYEGMLNNKPIYKTRNYKVTDLAAYFSQNFDFEGVNYNLAEIKNFQINLANSLGNVNQDGSLANISIQFANDLVNTVSTVPDLFTELALSNLSAIPQAFADFLFTIADINEAFANQVLDLATSTAYATIDQFNSLSAFTTQLDTNVTGLQADFTNLSSTVDTNTGAITANATALTALGVRVTVAETDVVALNTNFTNLEVIVNENTGDISTNATQISTLGTVVNTATTDIATLKTDVTLLESSIDTLSGEVTANASDISLLTTNVNTVTANVTALQTDVTTLATTVNNNTGDIATQATQLSLLTNRVTTAESNILNTQTNVTTLSSTVDGNTGNIATNASNISILQTNVSTAQADITGIITDIQQIETSVNNVTGDVEANAIAISGLGTRVTTAEADITNVQGNITTLTTNLNTQTGRIDTNVQNISTLSTTVTNNFTTLSGQITTVDNARITGDQVLTDSVTLVNSRVNDAEASIEQNFNTIAALDGTVSSTYSLNVNTSTGTVAGIKIGANNYSSNILMRADTFAVDMPNGTRVLTVNSTGLTIDGSGTFSGNLSAAGGTFTGTLSGVNGTFSGSLSAATGTFAGNLSAAGGTFAGDISAATGTFTGGLDAGFVNIANNIISIGVSSTYSTFGEVSFNWPTSVTAFSTVTGTNTNKVAEIKAFYLTGGSYNGGGISVKGIAGVNPGELRVGTDSNGFGNWSLQSGGASIFGSNTGLLFSAGNSSYNFQNVPSLGGSALYITSGGLLTKASSSMRYKHQVTDYDKGLGIINQLRPVYFKYIQDHSVQNAGFIAEEFEELGLKEFVRYDLQLRPDTIDYAQITALLVKGIQEQQQQIDALKAEIELLKAQ